MEDLQPFLDLGLKAFLVTILASISLFISLVLCTCMENKSDSRPKYMGCRPLTEEEMFGPVEKPAVVVVVVPPEIDENETVVETNSLIGNGHISESVRNKTATLNRQLPEIPQADSDPHNTYESTSELYATLEDTYFKVPRHCEPGPSTSPSLTLVEIYDPYSCVRDEVKPSKVYGKIKQIDSPIEQDGGYTKVLLENKQGSKKLAKQENKLQGKSTEGSSLPYESLSDLAPPIPDKHFDVPFDNSEVPDIITEVEPNSPGGQPVSFNSIPMGMIDDTESINEDSQMQENLEDENRKELSYTRISAREPLANLKAKQFESYYSVVPEDDTYAQVYSNPSIATTSISASAPINLYAEIEISSNSSGYDLVEGNENSLSNCEMPPAPPTVESLRSITIHSKEGGSEGPTHQRSSSETIDVSQMYATVDKNKRNHRSFERDSRASPDQSGLDMNELKQMLDNDDHNCRTPPFPMDLYESTGAKPKNSKLELSSLSKLNGFRDDLGDSGYETVKDIKNYNDETYDNLDKNYRIKNIDSDPMYNTIQMNEDESKKKKSSDPGYETVLDAIVNDDILDSVLSSANGQNLTSFITESYYETVEQKFNDPNYEIIRNIDSTLPSWIRPINNEQNSDGYETVESLNISRNTEKRVESLYDNGYESISSINKVQSNQVPNGPTSNSTVHSVNHTSSLNHTILPVSTQENSTRVNNHTTDRKIVQQDFKDL